MTLRNKLSVAVVAMCVFGGPIGASHAESLHDALLSAYRKNPSLNAARAGQRATDELVPQALSGWRPTVSATGTASQSYNYNALPGGATSYFEPQSENLTIKLNQPVFRGFRTTENTAIAEANVQAGRQQLLATEQAVLLNVIAAYVNVLRDQKIVALRQKDLTVLLGQQRATVERFKAGVLTRTDVAQSDAGVASQRAALATAIANARTSEASYVQYVGHSPAGLSVVRAALAPNSLDEALRIASETNPNILAAAQQAIAADHSIGQATASLLPQADLVGAYSLTGNQNNSATTPNSISNLTVSGVLSVPLYEAGLAYSQVRQAKQKASQSKISIIDATRQVRQSVVSAWEGFRAAQQAVTSNTSGVSASQLALNGVQQEYQVGSRSTVDVLNAELTLLNNQIALVSSQRDMLFTSYQLQAAMGRLTASQLRLGPVYDVKANYATVRNKWLGTSADVLK